MLVLVDYDALILLLLHELGHLLLDGDLWKRDLPILVNENGNGPLVLPIVVGRLVLEPGHVFLLHQHIAHLPVELDVVLLLAQLHQRVLFLVLVLVLEVLDLVRGVLEFLLLSRHHFAGRLKFLSDRGVLSFRVKDHVFLGFLFLSQFLGFLPLLPELLLVLALGSQLLCLLLLQLLTTHGEFIVELVHHGFKGFFFFLLIVEHFLLRLKFVLNDSLVVVQALFLGENTFHFGCFLPLELGQALAFSLFLLLSPNLDFLTFAFELGQQSVHGVLNTLDHVVLVDPRLHLVHGLRHLGSSGAGLLQSLQHGLQLLNLILVLFQKSVLRVLINLGLVLD